MAATDSATSILPDPNDVLNAASAAAAVAPDRADDLIASLADKQIDDLMADAGEPPIEQPPAEAVAAAKVEEKAEEVVTAVTSAAGELKAELDQMEAERAGSAVVKEAGVEAEPIAESHVPAPSFDPSRELAGQPTASAKEAAIASESPVGSTAAEPLSPDAEAVAKELAADVAMLSAPLPSVVEHAAEVAARGAWWRRAVHFALSLPMLALGAVNLPVQPMSDRGREIIGAIGILTLVNAAGLLAYVMFFARGH